MKNQTKKVVCLLVAIASILTIVSTVSYAYFTAMADVQEQVAELSTGTMQVKFSDGNAGINAELNFGESVTKKFTIENTGTLEASLKFFWDKLINTYTNGSLTYTLSQSTTEDGIYTEVVHKTNVPVSKISSRSVLANLTIPAKTTYYYNLVITLNYLEDVNQDADINANFNTSFDIDDSRVQSVTEKIIASSNGVKDSFDTIATTDEGVFEMADDYGTSYYFRGAVENNYVKFGRNASGQDMWWRIVRINGDGTLRIIYDGTQAYANGVSENSRFTHENQKFNELYDDTKYVGYMYGPANEEDGTTTPSSSKEEAQSNIESSNVKKMVDIWYKENIVDTGYNTAVADTLFCNDRSTPGKEMTNWETDTALGYAKEITGYGSLGRLIDLTNFTAKENLTPSLICPQKSDALTVSDTKNGNGNLTYPVGLITADEDVLAGATYHSNDSSTQNNNYYLFKGGWYWTLTPVGFNGIQASVLIGGNGVLADTHVYDGMMKIAPVINLSKEYVSTMTGAGTMTDPYRVEI